ncbi:MAG: cysteine hydrolase [Methylobacteriaceae bacterium]|nr:cysteine hydrolase [Methylobacteriaceae bacterium]
MTKLINGPLTERTVHLCIDMQCLFSKDGPWPTPWMERVLPTVVRLVERFSERTVFTRFIPPQHAEEMPGTWRRYYQHWRNATRAHLDPALIELMPPLAKFVPPAVVLDKPVYSAFAGRQLQLLLAERRADALVVTGSETDVCVLSTVLGAVDHGYRVILVKDGVCSSSDEGHDALLSLYHRRFSNQIEVADCEEIISLWPG